MPLCSLPAPFPVDSIIPSDEVLLLQFVYSNTNGIDIISSLVRSLCVDFGKSISSASLRSSTLCWCAVALGLPYENYFKFSIHILARRLFDSKTIDEGDLFATFILAQIPKSSAWRKHLQLGYRTIVRYLSKRKTLREMLLHFGPFTLATLEFSSLSDQYILRLKRCQSDFLPLKSVAEILATVF